MSTKQNRIDGFLRRSLLGEELVNTQFHLFTTRSGLNSEVTRPKSLFANNILLVPSSDYFARLLIEKQAADGIEEFSGRSRYEDGISFEDYGYDSDSDLDDEEYEAKLEESEVDRRLTQTSDGVRDPQGTLDADNRSYSPKMAVELDDWQVEAGANDIPSVKHISLDQIEAPKEAVAASASIRVQENTNASQPRILQSRHLFVKDTAFRTWEALLFYLYTDQISFLPLKSRTSEVEARKKRIAAISTDMNRPPPCSPKSMYRLATKIGLEQLQKLARDNIRVQMTRQNILLELSSKYISSYPEVMKIQVCELRKHIASEPVVKGLPTLIRKIARGEMPHAAEVLIELYETILSTHYPSAMQFLVDPVVQESNETLNTQGAAEGVGCPADSEAGVKRMGGGKQVPSSHRLTARGNKTAQKREV